MKITGRIISWNAGAERIKGYGADEINQTKAADGVGLAPDRFAHAEAIEHGAAFGRDHAATGFFAREIQPNDNDDALDAELAEMHGVARPAGLAPMMFTSTWTTAALQSTLRCNSTLGRPEKHAGGMLV